MRIYLVTYIVRGIKTCKEVTAKDEYDAKCQIFEMENTSSMYITILSVETWEMYGEITSLFNA